MKTVSSKHNELIGKKMVIDGWNVTVTDTTQTASGQIYYAVNANAIDAMYLEKDWRKLDF